MQPELSRVVNSRQPVYSWGIAGTAVVVLLSLTLWLYKDTVLHVTGYWNQWDSGGVYGHGYLALAISLYLIFHQRKKLVHLRPCASVVALLAVAALSLFWLAAAMMDIITVQVLALLLLILAIPWALLGSQVTRHLVFPFLILLFAIPVWSPLSSFLQGITAEASYGIARLIGVTVFRHEHLLILPAGQLAVKESCSGMGYLLAALTLGLLYAYLNYQTFLSRLVVVAIAACTAIIANILRVAIVVQQAYETDMQTSLVNDHFYLGWYLFGGMVFVLLLIDHAIARPVKSLKAGVGNPDEEVIDDVCAQGYSRQLAVLVATGAFITSAPVIAWWSHNQYGSEQLAEVVMPDGAAGWSGQSKSVDTWMPEFRGAVAGKSTYQKDDYEVYLYIGYYPKQQQGSELIYYQNKISNEGQWMYADHHELNVVVDGQAVLEQELKSVSGRRRLVWYWFRVAGFNTTSQYWAKGLQLLGLVTGKPQASVVAVAVDIDDIDSARDAMRDFITAMGPTLSMVADGQF